MGENVKRLYLSVDCLRCEALLKKRAPCSVPYAPPAQNGQQFWNSKRCGAQVCLFFRQTRAYQLGRLAMADTSQSWALLECNGYSSDHTQGNNRRAHVIDTSYITIEK
jgi:hypothetical protein